MRVIAGKFKGAKLASPLGEVRPTTDRAKESLFSVLCSRNIVTDAKCLDIFCGSGALGIEALSRGAESCVFIDLDVRNVVANTAKLGIAPRIMRADFRRALGSMDGEKFDLVFCDPPYASGFSEIAARIVFERGLLAQNGMMIVEHSSKNDLIIPQNACIIDKRTYGAATFVILGGEHEGDIRGGV